MSRAGNPAARGGASVDVVIPLYNKARFVRRAVESVLNQTYGNWRLIVVDDGSTDGGPDTLEKISDHRITVVRQENRGPGAARNTGMRAGAADLVAFLDADDEWLPTYLETAVSAFAAHPECAAVTVGRYQGPAREWSPDSSTAVGFRTGPWRCPATTPLKELKDAVDFFRPSSTVARRSALVRLGGFYDRFRCTYAEDSYLWLRLVMQEPIYRIVDPLVWMHTEASELGPGRRSPYPIPPILHHVDEVIAECPDSHRDLLAKFLDWYAVWVAVRLANQGEGRQAAWLLKALSPVPTDDEMAAALSKARRRSRIWLVRKLWWRVARA